MTDLFEALGFLARLLIGIVRVVFGVLETLMMLGEIGDGIAGLWRRLRGKRAPEEPSASPQERREPREPQEGE